MLPKTTGKNMHKVINTNLSHKIKTLLLNNKTLAVGPQQHHWHLRNMVPPRSYHPKDFVWECLMRIWWGYKRQACHWKTKVLSFLSWRAAKIKSAGHKLCRSVGWYFNFVADFYRRSSFNVSRNLSLEVFRNSKIYDIRNYILISQPAGKFLFRASHSLLQP